MYYYLHCRVHTEHISDIYLSSRSLFFLSQRPLLYLGNLFAFLRLSIFVNDMFAFNSTHLFFFIFFSIFMHFIFIFFVIRLHTATAAAAAEMMPQTHQKCWEIFERKAFSILINRVVLPMRFFIANNAFDKCVNDCVWRFRSTLSHSLALLFPLLPGLGALLFSFLSIFKMTFSSCCASEFCSLSY